MPKREPLAEKGRVRVHDPFELIRWLAISQPDPRKALAELVQNSLDAGARRIRVTRAREKGHACLKILDDGEGVIPEMSRPDALRYIATHIGHSRKRALSPEQRLQLMTQGQYGVGLLGFWSLGQMLEMRSHLPGQPPYRLTLYRDDPHFLLAPLRGKLGFDDRWTEVVVVGLHRSAMFALSARRAADYLASELRGQLLARDVSLVVEDLTSRGNAPRTVVVKPRRFLGEKLEGLGPIEVPGHPPIRLEVYVAGDVSQDDGARGIALYAAGTMVAESFDELSVLGLDHAPWTDERLTGFVEFPALRVPPGNRRGVIADENAAALAASLVKIEPLLNDILEARERERAAEIDRGLIRDLQRAFRDFYRHRPRYSMLPVRDHRDEEQGPAGKGEAAAAPEDVAEESLDEMPESPSAIAPGELFPPGPLASVRIVPPQLKVVCGEARRVRAEGLDERGRVVQEPVDYRWALSEPVGVLSETEGGSDHILFTASEKAATASLSVFARSSLLEVQTSIPVEVMLESPRGASDEGIPEPELVDQPGAPWRSRVLEGRWQVNGGHPDYDAVAARPALKLRYLALLFAKEVVLRSSQDPRLDGPLEQVIEVAAYADRKLAERSPRWRRAKSSNGGST